MSTPEQRWDGPIQGAIREHDRSLGHVPPVPVSPPVAEPAWFRRMPNGGTVYVKPSDSGNPYARIDEDTSLPRPVVDVELPGFEGER